MEEGSSAGAFGGELRLTAELREQLDLAPEESLRVLHSGARMLLLERSREASVTAIPWDRDLVLNAEVRAFPMADVLSMLHSAGKTGFLLFTSGDHEKSVYLQCGEVVFATSNQLVDRLGECLLRAEVITLAQLREAERMWSPTCRFGKALVAREVLSPLELWNGVRYQIEEIVRSLFAYTSGMVHFWEGEVEPDNVVSLTLPTRRLIAEGLRKRDELFKLLAMLEDPNVRLRRNEDYGGNLWGNERAFVEMLEAEDAFAALCRGAGFDLLSGARTVQLLRLVGAIRITCEDGSAAPASKGEVRKKGTELVRQCVLNHVRLLGELAAPMVAVEGGQVVGERLASVLKEIAATYPKLLEGLKVDPSGVLDPDDLLQRALRLPGDRERTVRAALGELASYLEFALLNHPKIEEPEHFLSAIEGLRAKLEL